MKIKNLINTRKKDSHNTHAELGLEGSKGLASKWSKRERGNVRDDLYHEDFERYKEHDEHDLDAYRRIR